MFTFTRLIAPKFGWVQNLGLAWLNVVGIFNESYSHISRLKNILNGRNLFI